MSGKARGTDRGPDDPGLAVPPKSLTFHPMTSSLPDKRRYSDEEVKAILERATEVQADPGASRLTDPDGMTLEELEEIAREADIDPGRVRRAAEEMDVAASTSEFGSGFLGAPTRLRIHRIVEGEASADTMDTLIGVIERLAGTGEPRLIGGTLSWKSGEGDRKLRISVESSGGRTLIRAEEDLKKTAGSMFGGTMGAGGGVGFGVGIGVGIGALGSPLFAILWPTGVIAACYYGVRKGYARLAGNRRDELQRIVDTLASEVSVRGRLPGEGED